MTSSDLRNGGCIKHEKYINRKVQGVLKWYQTMFFFLRPLKQNRNHNTSLMSGVPVVPKIPFSYIFSNYEVLTRFGQSISDCTLEESVMSPLYLSMPLSLFRLIIVFLISLSSRLNWHLSLLGAANPQTSPSLF